MKNKIIAIFISFILCVAFIVPSGIFAEENAADGTPQAEALNNEQVEDIGNSEQTSGSANANDGNGDVSESESSADEDVQGEEAEENATEPQMAQSPQNAPGNETPWAKLKKKIEDAGSGTITLDEDVIADLDEDAGKTINIKSGKNIVLKGNSQIKGIGFSSFNIENGGSLTINGPSISDAQIITAGNLILNSGKISDTKLEGPTIFVNSGTFTMNGGEISENEAAESSTPQPSNLTKTGDFYNYAPITLYGGTLRIAGGKVSSNRGFLKGGAIGAWGTEESKANVKILGGEITNNAASHDRLNAWGGAIFLENSEFELNTAKISQNTAEYGGGLVLSRSNAKISGGTISDNSNGEYSGKGGGILGLNSEITIEAGNFTKNHANGFGGGLFLDTCNLKINGGYYAENSSLKSGGALATAGTSKGQINAGLFENNNSNGFWGGGAIYNDDDSELTINRALIKDNESKGRLLIGANNRPISRQGGGIWNCPAGHTEINITNGIALFNNIASNLGYSTAAKGSGDDFANIVNYMFGKAQKSASVKLASRMLGGGYRLWYQDGSFQGVHNNWPEDQQTPRYNPDNPGEPLPYNTVIEEKKGAQLVYKSVPTQDSKDLAEQIATTIFKNNFAQGTGISGGAITNNGKLIFGEDKPYKIKIVKSWSGDDIKKRPESITLKMYVGEHYIEDIVLTKEENWTKTIKDFPDPDTLIDKTTGKVLPINFKEENSGKYVLSVTKTIKDKDKSTYTIDLENKIPKPPEPPEKITVEGSKTWDDAKNQDGKRPEEITINLLKNGEKIASKKVTEADGWKWKFENLEKYENGKLIEYTITEEKVEGYKTEITGNSKDGFVITNTYVPPEKPPTPPTPPKTPPEKPKSPYTSDRNNMNIMCIALLAASIAAIYTLRKKKNM